MALGIAGDPNGLAAATRLLASNPPWRPDFVSFAANDPNEQRVLYSLFTGLRNMQAEVLPSELRIYINQLFSKKDYETAYFVWLDFLSSH